MNVFLKGRHDNGLCFPSRFFPRGERAGGLPEIPGLPGQNQGRENHAGNGKSPVLLLPAEVSDNRLEPGPTLTDTSEFT